MLFILKDMVKSKTMVLAMVMIIGISYIGGLNNKNLNQIEINSVNIVESIN